MLSLTERNDSWQNMLTGLGSGRDKSTYSHLMPNDRLSLEYLQHLYDNDDIAARICELLPNEMMRQGMNISINGEQFLIESLGNTIKEALIKSRIFGAAFIYVGADDGQSQEQPLMVSRVKGVKFLNVLTVKNLSHYSHYSDPMTQKYGQCEVYRLITSAKNDALIHESRLIPLFGTPPLCTNQFPPSILQRIYPVLQQFHTAWQATAHLMTDAAQGVFKLKGLHSAVASNRGEELIKRMELVDMSRSISRSILLDAEDEDFRRDSYSFAGIPEILEKIMLRLAAAARMPVSLLMGQAPAGMNATGESDIRFFYDQVKAEQEAIKSKVQHLVRIYQADPEAEATVEFPALWQMTDREQAELRRMEAETDRIYLQEGVLLPEEVAIHRFGKSELLIDKESRAVLAEVERSKEDE